METNDGSVSAEAAGAKVSKKFACKPTPTPEAKKRKLEQDQKKYVQGNLGNGDVNFDVNFDAGQISPETLDGGDATDDPEIIDVYMDIQSPIQTLKILLQEKTKKDLSDYNVWLQNVQMLEPFKTLVDQCVKGEGLIQVDAQIFDGTKRINIADVVKPTEEVDNAMKSVEENIGMDADIIMSGAESTREKRAILKRNARALSPSSRGNLTGKNGQIELWVFLLKILTDKDYRNIIQWQGNQGEFKLVERDQVAALWGASKNNPNMNFEKMSRALRYYYGSDMISKVSGKRFVYKFVCDLKQLMGYNAQELSNMVNGVPKQPRPRRNPDGHP